MAGAKYKTLRMLWSSILLKAAMYAAPAGKVGGCALKSVHSVHVISRAKTVKFNFAVTQHTRCMSIMNVQPVILSGIS